MPSVPWTGSHLGETLVENRGVAASTMCCWEELSLFAVGAESVPFAAQLPYHWCFGFSGFYCTGRGGASYIAHPQHPHPALNSTRRGDALPRAGSRWAGALGQEPGARAQGHRVMSLQWAEALNVFQQAADWIGLESRKSLWGQFWSAHQRFFKYLCIAAKVRRLVELAREELARDKVSGCGLRPLRAEGGQACRGGGCSSAWSFLAPP